MEKQQAVDSPSNKQYELLIVGGGPAGLSAALMAGRARRKVLLVDGGLPRNGVSDGISGYLSRDGIDPDQFRDASLKEILAYPTVEYREGMVSTIAGEKGSFSVDISDGDSSNTISSSRILLAIGTEDVLPDIPGLKSYWGRGVYHCPYCDGYEHRDGKWALLADSDDITEALFLRAWTSSLVYLAHGQPVLPENEKQLRQHGIAIESRRIAHVKGSNGIFNQLQFDNGLNLELDCLWIAPRHKQRDLVLSLENAHGLKLDPAGQISRDEHGETSIPGLYAAGDIAADGVKQAIMATADGARVALCINKALIHEQYY